MLNNEETIDLRDIFKIIKRYSVLLLVTVVVGAVGGFSIAKFIIAPKYTSTATLYVNNTNTAKEKSINLNDINAAQKMISTYMVILQDEDVLQSVVAKLSSEYSEDFLSQYVPMVQSAGEKKVSAKGLKKLVSMSAVNNTEVLQIDVTTRNAMLSARICNIIVELAPSVLTRVVKAGSVEIISSAKVALGPSSPKVLNYLLIGAAVGLFISAAFIVLREMFDTRVHSSEDIEKKFNISLLGEVPDFTSKKKSGGYYRYEKYGYYE